MGPLGFSFRELAEVTPHGSSPETRIEKQTWNLLSSMKPGRCHWCYRPGEAGGCTEEPSGALGPDFCLELPHFMSSKRDAKIVVAHMRLGLWETKGKTRQKTSDFSETVYRNAPNLGLRGRSRVYSSRYDKTRQRKFPFYICPWRNPTARLCL